MITQIDVLIFDRYGAFFPERIISEVQSMPEGHDVAWRLSTVTVHMLQSPMIHNYIIQSWGSSLISSFFLNPTSFVIGWPILHHQIPKKISEYI